MRKLKYYLNRKRKYIACICVLYTFVTLGSMARFLGPTDIHNKTNGVISREQIHDDLTSQRNPLSSLHPAPTLPKSQKCQFYQSFENNLRKLESLELEEAAEIMSDLGLDKSPPQPITSVPVLVSGFDAGFFDVAQGLIQTIHENLMPTYPELKLIIYDLGLNKSQVKRLRKFCQCEVRAFPFDKLPPHVHSLRNYAFKPIIASMVFHEFGSVWWVDASARFLKKSMDVPFAYLHENGLLFFTYANTLNVALHTHQDTFNYFKEDPCAYKELGEIEAGNVGFTDSRVARVVVRLWSACGLIRKCISPENAHLGCPGANSPRRNDVGACHRFDQSVLSIILRRLYHQQNDYPDWESPFRFMKIARGQRVSYFPKD